MFFGQRAGEWQTDDLDSKWGWYTGRVDRQTGRQVRVTGRRKTDNPGEADELTDHSSQGNSGSLNPKKRKRKMSITNRSGC